MYIKQNVFILKRQTIYLHALLGQSGVTCFSICVFGVGPRSQAWVQSATSAWCRFVVFFLRLLTYTIHDYWPISWIHSSGFDNVVTKFMINNKTDAWKTDFNLLTVQPMMKFSQSIRRGESLAETKFFTTDYELFLISSFLSLRKSCLTDFCFTSQEC